MAATNTATIDYNWTDADRARVQRRQEERSKRIYRAQGQILDFWDHNGLTAEGRVVRAVEAWTSRPPALNADLIPFAVAYTVPEVDGHVVRAAVLWVDPDRGVRGVDREDSGPGVLCPEEILGLLTPIDPDSIAGLWRELSRRVAADWDGWQYYD